MGFRNLQEKSEKYICILIWFAGACLEWRIAVSLYAVVPICCFIMVVMSPESPYWLICKNRNEDALKSLTILRGKSNIGGFQLLYLIITELKSHMTC